MNTENFSLQLSKVKMTVNSNLNSIGLNEVEFRNHSLDDGLLLVFMSVCKKKLVRA